jgi:hypothetical protein
MGVLVGATIGNGVVNVSDIRHPISKSGEPVASSIFPELTQTA